MAHNNIRVVIPESPVEGASDASTAKRPTQAWESASYEGGKWSTCVCLLMYVLQQAVFVILDITWESAVLMTTHAVKYWTLADPDVSSWQK